MSNITWIIIFISTINIFKLEKKLFNSYKKLDLFILEWEKISNHAPNRIENKKIVERHAFQIILHAMETVQIS